MNVNVTMKTKVHSEPRVIKTDKDKVVIKCSNCNAALVNILADTTNADVETPFVAECCFCGDKSYQQSVKGLLRWSPAEGVIVVDIKIDYRDNVATLKTIAI